MKRYQDVKKASIFGIVGNIFLFIIKLIISIISHSKAMMADTFNSAGDIISSLMTYIGNKIASKPSDEDHNLGHGKAEYIYSMLVSLVIIYTSYIVLKDSIISIIKGNNYQFSIYLIIVCLITIIVKLLLYLYTRKIALIHHNLLMKANSKDHLNDIFIELLNVISIIFAYFNIYLIDSIVGVIIGIWIFITGFKVFKESYDILMDKSISDEVKDEVFKIINKHKEIKKVIHFNSTPVGYKYQISFTIYLDGNLSTFESHKIANDLEKEIDKKIDEIYLTVIHVNPWEEE